MMRKLILLCLVLNVSVWAQTKSKNAADQWADSVYESLTLEQRIGQLFMVAAYSNKGPSHLLELEKLVQEQAVGGLIFFQGGPQRQAVMTNRLQSLARVPMLVGIDGEWGLNMRLDSTYRFPYNMTLGAVQNMDLIEELGSSMAHQAKRMGLQFNFGPVVDININPKNPIIGVRSFGETRDIVTDRAIAFTKGYQSQGIFATAKHFPGHGDTSTDSHYSLPLMDLTKDRLHRVELYPYKKLIEEGLVSVMVAHLSLPAIEPDATLPTSLSYKVVTELLREEMGFEGLIFTDALNMKAAANYSAPGEVDLAAFQAGNDLLLFSENVPNGVAKIKEAFENNSITEERLAYSVKKILKYKFKTGLQHANTIELEHLVADLNDSKYDALNQKLYNEALTLLKNNHHSIPFKKLEQEKFAYLPLGDDETGEFLNSLKAFADVTVVTIEDLEVVNPFTTVIIGYHKVDNPWRNHAFSASEIDVIERASASKKTVLVSFAKAYALSGLYHWDTIDVVLQAYQNNPFAQWAAAQILFGTLEAKGKLPVTINKTFQVLDGLKTKKLKRLGFSSLEAEGMNALCFQKIDSIANDAINKEYTPGIQLVVARHGRVVYQKSYGYHTYDKKEKVQNTDLYDLASLTKILATTPMLMRMIDEQKITLNSPMGSLIPSFKHSDKEKLKLKEVLTHQAGLHPWIPFYKKTLDSVQNPSKEWYRLTYQDDFPTQVSENLYLKKGYEKLLLQEIAASKLQKKTYKYSDLGFIALKSGIERSYDKPLNQLVNEAFYHKIGATHLTYLPLQKFDSSQIVPSEIDTYFRKTVLQGYVHDMTAAMEGGVAGHAGLFSNALDVAKMMQMFLNKGYYGQEQLIESATVDLFNNCVSCKEGNRRGIGFDKPQLAGTPGPTCGCVTKSSFGHTGFTGTMAWADPEADLVYVFLSNRTFPDSNDNKLSKANVRENIQKLIYESIE